MKDIKLHPKSEKLIKETFGWYTQVGQPIEKINGRCVIHMYPTEDTYDENGELVGYRDALFFNVHVYDAENRICYIRNRADAITTGDVGVTVKYFKDGSTMLVMDGNIDIIYGQAICIHKELK